MTAAWWAEPRAAENRRTGRSQGRTGRRSTSHHGKEFSFNSAGIWRGDGDGSEGVWHNQRAALRRCCRKVKARRPGGFSVTFIHSVAPSCFGNKHSFQLPPPRKNNKPRILPLSYLSFWPTLSLAGNDSPLSRGA